MISLRRAGLLRSHLLVRAPPVRARTRMLAIHGCCLQHSVQPVLDQVCSGAGVKASPLRAAQSRMHNESTCSASLSQCGPRSSLVALRCSAPINDCFAGNPRRVPSLKMRTLKPKVFAQLLRASADPAGTATPGGVSPYLTLGRFRAARNSAHGQPLSCEHGLLQGATDVAMVEPRCKRPAIDGWSIRMLAWGWRSPITRSSRSAR
jgi:hypothetical protein